MGVAMPCPPGEVTDLLLQLRKGDPEAEAKLVPLVYAELRRLARHYLSAERQGHTLQPTALVHEAYLRLTKLKQIAWQNRGHFFAVSATIMRRVLVDHARSIRTHKRGLGWDIVSLNEATLPRGYWAPEILALDEALTRLALLDLRQAKIVELRFFGGMNEGETATALGLSTRTVKRDWRIAKAWLFRELTDQTPTK
jgi:RNA polymerase sigma-70 factor (ECF subfamily)